MQEQYTVAVPCGARGLGASSLPRDPSQGHRHARRRGRGRSGVGRSPGRRMPERVGRGTKEVLEDGHGEEHGHEDGGGHEPERHSAHAAV
jgi:hypothetical protein